MSVQVCDIVWILLFSTLFSLFEIISTRDLNLARQNISCLEVQNILVLVLVPDQRLCLILRYLLPRQVLACGALKKCPDRIF
jgi:hypothetical protein